MIKPEKYTETERINSKGFLNLFKVPSRLVEVEQHIQ